MDELYTLKQRMEQERPVPWEDLPDLALYMDQLISYMPRQLIRFDGGPALTSAMVNNYIKDGLMPRAEGKRYARPHLAYLTAICALKQVLPVKDAGLLVAAQEGTAREMYAHFRDELDRALAATAEGLDPDCSDGDLSRLALTLALQSYADGLACRRIMELLREKTPKPETKARKNKK